MRAPLLILIIATMCCNAVHAWLAPQTRREMVGTVWTAFSTLALDPAPPSNNNAEMDKARQVAEQEEKKRQQAEQRERDRIARETKARLAAGRIGTI